jgi:hypothetical protein
MKPVFSATYNGKFLGVASSPEAALEIVQAWAARMNVAVSAVTLQNVLPEAADIRAQYGHQVSAYVAAEQLPGRPNITQLGNSLYGTPNWQSIMARDLNVNVRTVQRWAAGCGSPNENHWEELEQIFAKRIDLIRFIK